MFRLLLEGRICPVEGLITQEDMTRQKTYILSEQYKEDGRTFPAAGPETGAYGVEKDGDISGYRYCTEHVIKAFIEECAEMLAKGLHV